jgi:hypothetical protein
MRRYSIVLVLAVVAACGKKPERAKAEAACEHAVELGFFEAQGVGKLDDAAAKALLEDQKKGPLWKDAVEKCTNDAMNDSSPDQVACVLAAKVASDMDKCK